jgi:hypothetical protein
VQDRKIIDGNDHFSTSPDLIPHTRAELENKSESSLASGSASTSGTGPTQTRTWTSLLTQSMSIVGGGYGSDMPDNLNVLDFDNSYDSYHTPPPSPCAGGGLDVSVEVFVTPPSSPATTGTGQVTSGVSLGSSIPTPPCTNLTPLRTKPCLSDVFVPQVPDIPAPNVDPGPVPMPSATLGPALAGLSVASGVDFIQINCGKRITAMTLLEKNVRNKIALIQEPYTSKNGCTLLHKKDFFCFGMATPGTAPTAAAPGHP